MDLVSVIVPIYNVEKYLDVCIDAICNQTYTNIEIILIDDGSTDNSGIIADKWGKIDNRIKVIHKTNAGLGYARNTGLEVATGEFVTFVDSDDLVDNNLLELLMNEIKNGADTCVGGFKRINEDGSVISIEEYKCSLYKGLAAYNDLFARMLGSSPDAHDAIKMSVWNVIYSMDLIRKYNLKFPSEREFISEDIYFNYEYFKHSRVAKLIDSTAYGYRVTPGSLTQKYNPQRLERVCYLYVTMEEKIGDAKMVTRLQRQFFVNIRACLRQERTEISGKTRREIKKTIKEIVDNPVVSRVSNSYLKCINQFKQKVFVFLLKSRSVELLYLVSKYKLI